jgi:hypothetical protein
MKKKKQNKNSSQGHEEKYWKKSQKNGDSSTMNCIIKAFK